MDRMFEDRVALVTGAAGAIGKGIAADFCQRGAKVFVTDLDAKGLDAAVAEIAAATRVVSASARSHGAAVV